MLIVRVFVRKENPTRTSSGQGSQFWDKPECMAAPHKDGSPSPNEGACSKSAARLSSCPLCFLLDFRRWGVCASVSQSCEARAAGFLVLPEKPLQNDEAGMGAAQPFLQPRPSNQGRGKGS